ncbi:MAG TPA: helix-turn-helix domain-containing protein [Gemmataceae bacterium]|nr:helix-turn-helix domain-containing protein [Gemmataceae bacterium]
MRATAKLSSKERRAAIIKAVRSAFAEKGFHGTTTRELAEAAEVSEALLFKHFPNKEALYAAMMLSCCQEKNEGMARRLMALEPSASTLVLMVHLLVSHMLGRPAGCDGEEGTQIRLMLRSMLEDGEFARLFLQGMPSQWVRKVEECIQAAVAAGEASEGPLCPSLRGWFAHDLVAMLMIHLFPAKPVIDYGLPREKLVEHVVWFALRGMGIKEEVIQRHYNPKALALFAC